MLDFSRLNSLLRASAVLDRLALPATVVYGLTWRGKCPFHASGNPKSRSLHVDLGRNVWFCHKCRRGGNLIGLWADVRAVTMYAAAHQIAAEFGFYPERE